MAVVLARNSYGKSQVRLTKITRHADRHQLDEWSVDVELKGDFTASYTAGDNRQVVATDTMKNTVYVLAKDHPLSSPEDFALVLGHHFLQHAQVESAQIHISVGGWNRIEVAGTPHPHAFIGAGPERRNADVTMSRAQTTVSAGIDDAFLLKTTDSAFRDFHHDAFTTLPDADDRILATVLAAQWHYTADTGDWHAQHAAVRQAMLEVFATHMSLAVQQTLFAMGEAALERCPFVDSIDLTMPNRHRLLVNLKPFGRENANEVFVATDEPYGVIKGTLRRKN